MIVLVWVVRLLLAAILGLVLFSLAAVAGPLLDHLLGYSAHPATPTLLACLALGLYVILKEEVFPNE